MLDHSTRTAILRLRKEGHGTRSIAKTLKVSRKSVCKVIASKSEQVPVVDKEELAEPYRDEILKLFPYCKGNLVRVHEELAAQGAELSYQALTGFCRRNGIGREPALPAGSYHFDPGEEMQHDTSPHKASIAKVVRQVQTASLVLCYSHMLFFQMFPRFTRFECKVFLTDAAEYFEGTCDRCMVDNTSVIVLHGTGQDMVPVPEMVAFAERLGFQFVAHEKGDANRSARVERPFHYIENNFLAGREFESWQHLNREARNWCDKVNATFSARLRASRRELYAVERVAMNALPIHVPEVYRIHQRIVDTEGFVNVDRNRYSVPYQLIGRPLEVRETKDRIDVYHGPRLVASHPKQIDGLERRIVQREHRPERSIVPKNSPCPYEVELLRIEPGIGKYLTSIKESGRKQVASQLRRLLQLLRDYPRESVLEAICRADRFKMLDLSRLETMILRQVAKDYFVVNTSEDPDER